MGYLLLSEHDQKRYGINGRIEFVSGQYGLKAVAAMKKQTGYTLEYLQSAIQGKPVLDENNQQVYEPVIGENGEPELNEDGTPKLEEKVESDDEAMAVLVWLILWAAGHKIPWDDFDVFPVGLKVSFLDDGETEEGKAETTPDTSSTTVT